MCLGIPMQIIEIDGLKARCAARGVTREISLFLLQDDLPRMNDYVMVHLGQAIRTMGAEEAQASWALLDEILALAGNT